MSIEILRVSDNQLVKAAIVSPVLQTLPSVNDGWLFDFASYSDNPTFKTYLMVCNETPGIVEGCIIFLLKNNEVEPYKAYVEAAPHNKGAGKHYDYVVRYLI